MNSPASRRPSSGCPVQEYTRQRTVAMREELELHYFSQQQPLGDIDE